MKYSNMINEETTFVQGSPGQPRGSMDPLRKSQDVTGYHISKIRAPLSRREASQGESRYKSLIHLVFLFTSVSDAN